MPSTAFSWLVPLESPRRSGNYLVRAAPPRRQLGTMSSALVVRASVYYGAEEVEPIHDAHHSAVIGDDDARNPLTHHLVGGNDLAGSHLHARDLRAHDLFHRPLGHPSKVVDPLVPGLGDKGDVLHYLQIVGQRGGQKMSVGDETHEEPFLVYHRNSRRFALEQDTKGLPLGGARCDGLDRLHDRFELDVPPVVLAERLLATHARLPSFDRRAGRLPVLGLYRR